MVPFKRPRSIDPPLPTDLLEVWPDGNEKIEHLLVLGPFFHFTSLIHILGFISPNATDLLCTVELSSVAPLPDALAF